MLVKSWVQYPASASNAPYSAESMTLLQELQARLFLRRCVSDPVRVRVVAATDTAQPGALSHASGLNPRGGRSS